jgi:uncharacterized protein
VSSESYHEPYELLSPDTRDMHRAVVSLKEELEAVDWYQQRAEAATDPELKGILLHNRREEIEHAMMVLEWIRRRDANFEEHARTYVFSEGAIVGREEATKAGAGEVSIPQGDLGIGSLKGARG